MSQSVVSPSEVRPSVSAAHSALHLVSRNETGSGTLQSFAHDLRGLCATIHLVSEELGGRGHARSAVLARRLHNCHDRMLSLCEDMLPRRSQHRSREPLHAVLNDVATLASGFADHDTAIFIELQRGLGELRADRALFRILFNLVTNAARAVGDVGGGEVGIIVREIEGVIFFDVRDDGPGLLSVNLPKPGDRENRGYGLGLGIAEKLARSLGGRLDLIDTSSAGTTFRFTIERSRLERP